MRRTYISAIIIAILASLWLASGQLRDKPPKPPLNIATQNRVTEMINEERPLTPVRVSLIHASEQIRYTTIRGRTQNKRTVVVRAQVGGTLVERHVERGDRVEQDQMLCRISMDDRDVAHAQAKAELSQARMEYEGILQLSKEGLQSEIVIARARTGLAAAEASVRRSGLELSRLDITAPFAGIIEEVQLEPGDYVTPGTACATLVDLDPMLLVGGIPEREFGNVRTGAMARGVVSSGVDVNGPVTFVGKTADEFTRTYGIEVQVPNADYSIPSGVSVQIDIPVETVMAQRISSALLALDDAGRMGVRTIDKRNIVYFHTVEIVGDADGAIWVTGLPDISTVITVGQEFVVPGEEVNPVFSTAY